MRAVNTWLWVKFLIESKAVLTVVTLWPLIINFSDLIFKKLQFFSSSNRCSIIFLSFERTSIRSFLILFLLFHTIVGRCLDLILNFNNMWGFFLLFSFLAHWLGRWGRSIFFSSLLPFIFEKIVLFGRLHIRKLFF